MLKHNQEDVDIREIVSRSIEHGRDIFQSIPYDDRLCLAAYFFSVLRAQLEEGGSYRYLIYDRLNFNVDAYGLLQLAGALDVNNALFDAHETETRASERSG